MILLAGAALAGPWLVGVRNGREALTTVWVDEAGLTPLGPGLAVPGPDGWWRAEPVRWGVGGYTEVSVRWVAPDGSLRDPAFSVVRGAGRTGASVTRLVGVGTDRVTTETVLDATDARGAPLRQTTTRTAPWPPGGPALPADAAPEAPGPVALRPDLRLVVDGDGLHLVADDGAGADLSLAGAALVFARPVPAGAEAAWRAAAAARLAR